MTDTQLECDIYMYSLFGIALTGAGAIGLVELGPILGFTAGGAIEGTGFFGAWEAIQNWLDETPGVPGIPSGPPASTPRVITGGAGTSTTGAAASDEVSSGASYIRYMTNAEYQDLGATGELKFGEAPVYATSEYVETNAELAGRGGIVQPKDWGVRFQPVADTFRYNGLAKYPLGDPLQGEEILGGIPEYISDVPVAVLQVLEVWPIK